MAIRTKDYNLEIINPDLAGQWHPTKNGGLTPKDVTPKSGIKVWWICSKVHEWKSAISARSNGVGCPYCSGRRVCKDNCLETVNPKITKQWHPVKNGNLTPKDVTPGSNKKVWWLCDRGHEWQATINHRNRGSGCPYCVRLKASSNYCLQTVNPALAKQWHPTKNGKLTSKNVTPGSGKKAWWVCGKGHEWKAVIAHRNLGDGCPYCAAKLVCDDNCLQTMNPDLARQWHPTRNSGLTPKDVFPYSGRKAWWVCERGHEWKAAVGTRSYGSGCPYCPRKVYRNNYLDKVNPILAREWHPTKNGCLTPGDVTCGSKRKAWWICKKGHEWEARIFSRSRGRGCPYCYRENKGRTR